ncbi:MFS transporter [Corallincola luteus]|uniref:MFS transporter n=1 Tax=Corallincola luteus TaxID=1775177 RepID=A0ABY2AKY5_9GAMM|nr:MFS transporter [Corallincola luteus]TCI03051.1 MFS transporter [Corallincola luteus]
MERRQYLSLGAGYFSFFAILGLMVPYLSVFLDGRGYSSLQIGELLAIVMATRIISPNLWAAVADHTGKRVQVMRGGALVAFLCFFAAYPDINWWFMALAMASFSFFWTAILPQLEVLTLRSLGEERHRYSRLRAWGSVGFIVVVICAGYVVEQLGSEAVVYIGSVLLILLLLSTLLVRELPGQNDKQGSTHFAANWLSRPMLMFMAATILLQISHGPYYGFFVLYMEGLGHSAAFAGWLISLGVVAEIVLFMVSGQLLKRWGVKWLLSIAMALTALRWLLLGLLPESLAVLLFSQTLHAASFGLTHAASIQFIHGYFTERQQGRGQAMYNSVGFGIGGALGAWIAGVTWQQGAGAMTSYLIAALAATAACMLVLAIPRQKMA